MRAGSSAAAQQATAFLAAALGATGADAQGAGGAEDGEAKMQTRVEQPTGSSEQGATAMRGGGDDSDDEPPRQRAREPRGGRQVLKGKGAGSPEAEVVQGKAGERKARRARTDPGMEGNGLSTPARDNGNDSDGMARATTRRTPTRGKIYKIGSLDSSGRGKATTEGAQGGGAPTSGR